MTVAQFDKSGNYLFVADKDSKTITLFNMQNFQLLGKYHGHNGVIWQICTSTIKLNEQDIMISCSGDMTFIVWDIKTGNILTQIDEKGIPKNVSINNNLVAISCDSISKRLKSYITIYKLDDLIESRINIIAKNEEESGIKITSVNWLNDTILIISLDNGIIKMYNYETNKIIIEKKIHKDSIKSVKFNFDKTCFVTASIDHTAKIIDSNTFEIITTLTSSNPINYAVFSPDNKFVILGGGHEAMLVATKAVNDTRTKIYKTDDGSLYKQLSNHFGPIRYIDFNNQNQSFVTASQDGTMKIHYLTNLDENKYKNNPLNIIKFGFCNYNNISTQNDLTHDDVNLESEILNYECADANVIMNANIDTKTHTHTNTNSSTKQFLNKNNKSIIYPPGHPEYAKQKFLEYAKQEESKKYKITNTKTHDSNESSTIKITNLPIDVELRELWEIYEFFGRIEDKGIRIKKYNEDTVAYINYSTREAAEKAIKTMHGKSMGYCIIHIELVANKY